MAKIGTIHKDELIGVARKAEALATCLADIELEYFGSKDYKNTLLYDADRLRRYVGLCFDLAADLTKELHNNDIWCFDKDVVA